MNKTVEKLVGEALVLVRRTLRIVEAPESVDWDQCKAALWKAGRWGGEFVAHRELDNIALDDLLCIDDQKHQIELNTRQFIEGFPANNVLLWGARGTGKSSLVHSLLNCYSDRGLRLVEVNKSLLMALPDIVYRLQDEPFRFILFCDDLSFEADDPSYKVLKSALEGSIFKSSQNVLIYATSNRRHLLPEYMSDNEGAIFVEGELHQSEAVEEKISLSDRFGLWISFYPFNQEAYLKVVSHWLEVLADLHNIKVVWDEDARAASLRWALARGVRSGRTAQHFARHWTGALLTNEEKKRK